MTRKHFEALAAIVRSTSVYPMTPRELGDALALVCAETNPNFDREQFLKACGQ